MFYMLGVSAEFQVSEKIAQEQTVLGIYYMVSFQRVI